jgi:hypothetical protein
LTLKHEANFHRELLYPPIEIRVTTPDQADPSTSSAISREKKRMDSTLSGLATLDRQRVDGEVAETAYKLKTYKPKKLLSPLKYQRHAERTTKLSVKSLFECEYHLHCSQTRTEVSYTRIALSEGLAGKFRLFLDFNFIPRNEHSHDGYSLCLEEPGRIVSTVLSRIVQ